MSWKPPWTKPNGMDARARALQEEEEALAQQMQEIRQQMESLKNPPTPEIPRPVWRAEPSEQSCVDLPVVESAPKLTTRTHRAQQKRDRNLFIILFVVVLFVIMLLVHVLK